MEKDIERKLKQKVESLGCLCLKFVSPQTSGVPDRIIVAPSGISYFVECKFGKNGRVSVKQDKIRKLFNARQHTIFYISSEADIYNLGNIIETDLKYAF